MGQGTRAKWECEVFAEPIFRQIVRSASREKGLDSSEGSPSQTHKRRMNSALKKVRHQTLVKASGMNAWFNGATKSKSCYGL